VLYARSRSTGVVPRLPVVEASGAAGGRVFAEAFLSVAAERRLQRLAAVLLYRTPAPTLPGSATPAVLWAAAYNCAAANRGGVKLARITRSQRRCRGFKSHHLHIAISSRDVIPYEPNQDPGASPGQEWQPRTATSAATALAATLTATVQTIATGERHGQKVEPLMAALQLRDRATAIAGVVSVVAVLALQLLLFPVPVGVWIQGLVLGLLGSLMALGLGLVYRLNKVINFSQGDLGTAPAVLAFGLIGFSGANYFLGLAVGIAAVILVTFILEFVVIRRFRRSPRLILTVVTIGLSQFLVALSLIIPSIWSSPKTNGAPPISTATVSFPWSLTWHLTPVVFNQNHLVAVVVSVLALIGVWLWFTRTDIGIAVQAAGDRRDRAAMLGIPVGRLQSVTWIVAGVLSFATIFFQGAILGLPLDPTFGLTALVTALAALALGNFFELPVIAASAIALGILQQGISWDEPNNPSLGLAVLAAIVFVAIVARQLLTRRNDRGVQPTLALTGSARELSDSARLLPEVKVGRPTLTLVALAAALTLPLWMGPGELIRISSLVVFAIVGCSIVVLTGWSGQVSLGQMSFAAVGAVVGAVAVLDWHWDLSLAILVAGAAGGVASVIIGIPTLRLDGMFAAVTTLAFALAASSYLLVRDEFSWIPQGQIRVPVLFGVPIGSQTSLFEMCLGVLVLVLLGLHGLRHSRTGRVLRALPSNQRAASSYGVSVMRAKLTAFAVSGFIAGIAGCLLLVVNQQYEENSYLITASLLVFTSTAVGGLGSAFGAVLGAAIVEGSIIFLPGNYQQFPAAIGVLLVLILFPRGIAGLIEDLRDMAVNALFRRRGLPGSPTRPGASGSGGAGGDEGAGQVEGALV
jgi:branched-chain amino acid transport system permease protein